jgi:hypothetical protein
MENIKEIGEELEKLNTKAEETTQEESLDSSEKEMALDLSAQLKEMVDALDKELKDTNPLILLGVFALGLFVGRLLPK